TRPSATRPRGGVSSAVETVRVSGETVSVRAGRDEGADVGAADTGRVAGGRRLIRNLPSGGASGSTGGFAWGAARMSASPEGRLPHPVSSCGASGVDACDWAAGKKDWSDVEKRFT